MIDAHWIRSSLAAGGIALGALGAMYAFVAGCGSGNQDTPPASAAQAQTAGDDGTPGGMHHRHKPPPAAFDACKAKAVGDACTVSMHDREINGKCESPPAGSDQAGPACRPEGWSQRHHGPPPEIVFAACDGKAAGDACSVAHEQRTVQGSCMAPRMDGGAGRLLCAAAHGRGRGGDAGGGT